jgi:peptidoglycan/xylan/chitin deacetylase (PgdA/CDA1 family)
MYHSIDTKASPGFVQYVLDPGAFRAHLDYLVEHGYTAVTVSQLARARRDAGALPPRPVALTFDDGYADFYTTALPELVIRKLTATLFVATAYVGSSARWLTTCNEQDRPMMSWSAIKDVCGTGLEVAAHSRTHPHMDLMPAADATAEAVGSRHDLEEALGVQVQGFAYPFGAWNARSRRAVEAAGYAYACQVAELTSRPGGDLLALPRHSVNGGAGDEDLARLLDITSGRVDQAVADLKRVISRAARRLRPEDSTTTASSATGARQDAP